MNDAQKAYAAHRERERARRLAAIPGRGGDVVHPSTRALVNDRDKGQFLGILPAAKGLYSIRFAEDAEVSREKHRQSLDTFHQQLDVSRGGTVEDLWHKSIAARYEEYQIWLRGWTFEKWLEVFG